jgi:hypothetical protein
MSFRTPRGLFDVTAANSWIEDWTTCWMLGVVVVPVADVDIAMGEV